MPSVREKLAEVQALAARVLVTPGPPVTFTIDIAEGRPRVNCPPPPAPVSVLMPWRVDFAEGRSR